jgi:hypothetical protein
MICSRAGSAAAAAGASQPGPAASPVQPQPEFQVVTLYTPLADHTEQFRDLTATRSRGTWRGPAGPDPEF